MKNLAMIVAGMLLMAMVFVSLGEVKFTARIENHGWEIKKICTDDGDCIDEQVPMDAGQDGDAYVVCFQTDYLEAECFEFSDVWHENTFPFSVTGVNPDYKTLFVEVDGYFTRGDDGSCQSFGALINNMLEEMPEGWQVYVVNEWVPSNRNPIDLNWSRKLAEGY